MTVDEMKDFIKHMMAQHEKTIIIAGEKAYDLVKDKFPLVLKHDLAEPWNVYVIDKEHFHPNIEEFPWM